MAGILDLSGKEKLNILGLMSGTSCDGLDLALIEISGLGSKTEFNVIACESLAYSVQTREALLSFLRRPEHTLKEISQLNFYMARLWADQVEQFFRNKNLKRFSIDLIASHGQTIWHQPFKDLFFETQTTSTLQLGDPSVLANYLQIPVVGDFRVADMALDGQGAPLIPYFDWVFFSRFKKNIMAVNIGGISNITFVPADGDFSKLKAFDCGPGNMLIDGAMLHLFKKPFDTEGNLARSGKLSEKLIEQLKSSDPFIEQMPPKSTGREQYNETFLNNILLFAGKNNISAEDTIHTLSYYTAESIYKNYCMFIDAHQPDELAVGGGGSKNSFIMEKLSDLFNASAIKTTAQYGLDEDFKEAIGFAILANETIHGKPSNVPAISGASRPAILGKICLV